MERTEPSTRGRGPCERCDEQGSSIASGALPGALAGAISGWQELVADVVASPGGADLIATRPGPEVWSAIEYAGHVRDFLAVTARHIRHLQSSVRPRLEPWDPTALVECGHYGHLWPGSVLADLVLAGRELTDLLVRTCGSAGGDPVHPGSFGAAIEARGRLALHETRHHLDDARFGLADLRR